MFPFDALGYPGQWKPFDGLSLVDAVDRLYREAVDRATNNVQTQTQTERGSTGGRAHDLKTRLGDRWWAAYGPAAGMLTPTRGELPDLPPGRDYHRHWSERQLILHTVFAQVLADLRSGAIVVEADGDHTIGFERVRVPVGFWRAANWVFYRGSPHDHALPRLVALDGDGNEIPPVYYNPTLTIALLTTEERSRVPHRLSRRLAIEWPDPRSKRAEMLSGLELAFQAEKFGPE